MRLVFWFAIFPPFILGLYPFVVNTEYVVTIANGLVTAQSILVALAIFSIDRGNKSKRSLHLFALLLLLLVDVVGGYQLILANELLVAAKVFLECLLFHAGF